MGELRGAEVLGDVLPSGNILFKQLVFPVEVVVWVGADHLNTFKRAEDISWPLLWVEWSHRLIFYMFFPWLWSSFEGCGTFRRKGLAGRRMSLGSVCWRLYLLLVLECSFGFLVHAMWRNSCHTLQHSVISWPPWWLRIPLKPWTKITILSFKLLLSQWWEN